MKKITGLATFFKIVDEIHQELKDYQTEFSQTSDYFPPVSHLDYEIAKSNCKPYKKYLHIANIGARSSNKVRHDDIIVPHVFMWQTFPNYNKGNTKEMYDKVWNQSERKKLIHSENGIDFCLVRDHLRGYEATNWGHSFTFKQGDKYYPYEYAIFQKDNCLIKSPKRWELEAYCDGVNEEVEERWPETPSEVFRYHNPFKILIYKFEDEAACTYICDKFNFGDHSPNSPSSVYNELVELGYVPEDRKNKWLCIIIGLDRGWGHHKNSLTERNCTYWIVDSKKKPTTDEAIEELMHYLKFYYVDSDDDFSDFIIKAKEEYECDLNKMNLRAEKRMHYLFTKKMPLAISGILDVNIDNLIKFYNEHV